MDEECETSSLHETEINRRLSISKDHIALDVLNTSDGTRNYLLTTTNNNTTTTPTPTPTP